MKLSATSMSGLHRLEPLIHRDERGEFVKTYHRRIFAEIGLNFHVVEEFFSTSRQGVVRGMHLQLPPVAHSKVVFCIEGCVQDVVVDLRRSSPMFGRVHSEELNDRNRHGLFIPPGFAHGFLTLSNLAVMYYLSDAEHAPACDAGIHWNSFGFSWNISAPIISQRDQDLPALSDFASPF